MHPWRVVSLVVRSAQLVLPLALLCLAATHCQSSMEGQLEAAQAGGVQWNWVWLILCSVLGIVYVGACLTLLGLGSWRQPPCATRGAAAAAFVADCLHAALWLAGSLETAMGYACPRGAPGAAGVCSILVAALGVAWAAASLACAAALLSGARLWRVDTALRAEAEAWRRMPGAPAAKRPAHSVYVVDFPLPPAVPAAKGGSCCTFVAGGDAGALPGGADVDAPPLPGP